MKRRIGISNLQELTPEQQAKLREWWKPQEGDFVLGTISKNDHIVNFVDNDGWMYCADGIPLYGKENYLPLLDIAQMIELLQSNLEHVRENWADRWGECSESIEIEVYKGKMVGHPDFSINISFLSADVCDSLWEAVKFIL